MPRFNVEDKFNKDKAFSRVKFGRDATLLDVELNEMQKIAQYKSEQAIRIALANGVVNKPNMTLSAGTITVPVDIVVVDGKVIEIIEPMTLAGLTTGDKVYLSVWESEVAHSDTIKKGGNLSGGTNISNADIIDTELGEESSRRIQTMVQLTKTNTDTSKSYLLLATLLTASTFTDNRVKVNSNVEVLPSKVVQDANNRFFTDTERTKLAGVAQNANNYTHPATHPPSIIVQDASNRFFTDAERTKLQGIEANATNYTHPATHPASIIVQDLNNRFVTDAEKSTWNAKETVSGAQTKATTAENNAKAYTDTKISALVASAPSTLDTLKELSDALGNDANFSTTITNLIATKETPAGAQAKATTAETNAINFVRGFGLGDIVASVSGSADDINATGLYRGFSLTNQPPGTPGSSNDYYYIHMKHSNTYKTQIAINYVNGVMHTRVNSNGVWSSWTQIESTTGAQAKVDSHANNAGIHVTTAQKSSWDAKAETTLATPSLDGLMPKTDKAKLDGIATGANNYVHPSTHPPSIIAQDSNNRFMTDAERTKLSGIATGANNYVHPSTHPATMITEDSSHKFVTDAQISSWDAKETPAGAQSKADSKFIAVNTNSGTDWNSLVTPGISDILMVGNQTNGPGGVDYYYVMVAKFSTNVTQVAIPYIVGSGTLTTRSFYNGVWTPWTSYETPQGAQTKVNTHAGDSVAHITSTERSNWNAKASTAVATTSANGLMSSTDKTKLDGFTVVTTPTANAVLKLNASGDLPTDITGNSATATKLATARTISLTGDVTGSVSFDGSGNASIATTFKNSGVTAGTYTKVTVDAKGNITAGSGMVASDIPSLDWSKITSGKPNTLAGYGIVDAVQQSTVSATIPATAGWYRVATSPIDIGRCAGNFDIVWAQSGVHGEIKINAGIMFGVDPTINQLMYSSFNTGAGITQVRIVYSPTYEGKYAYLEVYNATPVALPITLELSSAIGWSLITPITGSIPSGYSPYTITLADGIITDGQFVSVAPQGTSPLQVASSTLVPTLNVDLLDGYHASTGATANTVPVRDASGNLPGNILGNSATATKLATARTIALSGTVTGSTTFDGSGNATIATSVANATTGANGLMSSADKSKLDGVATGATNTTNHASNGVITVNGVAQTVYAHPTGAGNNHIPSGGATGNFLKYSASGTAVWSGIAGTDVTQATTAVRGTVQLNDTVTSTSTTLAGTANAVKKAYDRAEQAFQSANDGKTAIANAVTAKGVSASSADTFSTLATKIGQIGGIKKVTLTKLASARSSKTDSAGGSVTAGWVTFTQAEVGFYPERVVIIRTDSSSERISATVFTGNRRYHPFDQNNISMAGEINSYSHPFTGGSATTFVLPVLDAGANYYVECYSG